MSKTITVEELKQALKDALKPIIDDIDYLKKRGLVNDTQITEMHRELNKISVKLDTVDEAVGLVAKAPPKRTAKKIANEPVEKKKAKSTETKVDKEGDKDDDKEEYKDFKDENDENKDDISEIGDDDSIETRSNASEGKKPVKRAIKSDKKIDSKIEKKSSKSEKKTSFNKLNQFRKVFGENEDRVMRHIPSDAVSKIESSINGTNRKTQRVKAYYEYILQNKPSFFEELKKEYDA